MTFNTKGLMSSFTDERRTPQSLFDKLDAEFHFDSDPCPMKGKPLKQDLSYSWLKSLFINPPYSQIKVWVEQGYIHGQHTGVVVVMLIPSRTDTKWWHDFVMKADEIRFIKGRLRFNDGKGSAPFPSAIVVFRGKQN